MLLFWLTCSFIIACCVLANYEDLCNEIITVDNNIPKDLIVFVISFAIILGPFTLFIWILNELYYILWNKL